MVSDPAASVLTGRRLGVYQLQDRIGVGGMGEVYRARDTKLGRDVAIKILPRAFTTDPDRLARFEREARVLASLNHPNIGAIYGFEEGPAAGPPEAGHEGGEPVRALVLELVEGDTLAERVRRGPVPVPEALTIAGQIADALDAAHEKRIVHRDLKPANIKITPSGVVKVLDFGLAKAGAMAVDEAGLASDAPTIGGTREGTILGTAPYMSPEQARGQAVDKRSDIWAFGCVLYEMLTGRAPFARATLTDTLAAVVNSDPDWTRLPGNVPAGVRRLLRHCLEKDPKNRLRDIGDARAEWADAVTLGAAAGAVPAASKRALIAIASTAIIASAIILGLYFRQEASPVSEAIVPIARFVVTLNSADQLVELDRPVVAFSRDGTRFVYAAKDASDMQLFVRSVDELESEAVAGTERGSAPFLSPDGEWIGFFADGKLKRVPIGGGAPVEICDTLVVPMGASWGANGTIVLGSTNGSPLLRVAVSGGKPEPLAPPTVANQSAIEAWPETLPDGNSVLFTLLSRGQDPLLVAQSLLTGERKTLTQGTAAHYLLSGHLVFMRDSALMAVPFDATRLELRGTPIALPENVRLNVSGAAHFSVSPTGSLVYLPANDAAALGRDLMLVDRGGRAQRLPAPTRPYVVPRLSPDGRLVAVAIEGAGTDIWVYDLLRDTLTRLTFDGRSQVPIWTPDGRRIMFVSARDGTASLYVKNADGSGGERRLSAVNVGNPHAFTPDGRSVVTARAEPGAAGSRLWLVPLEGDRTPRPLLPEGDGPEQNAPAFSPDGRWLAYVSNASGRREIYVRPFPAMDGKWLISTDGGTQPMWARDGRELFYRNGDRMMAVEITSDATFTAAKPRVLFEGRYASPAVRSNYDVAGDGQHFIMVRPGEQALTANRFNVVVNWVQDVRRRATAGEP